MFYQKCICVIFLVVMLLTASALGEGIMWLTGFNSAESWCYTDYRINVYDCDARTMYYYDIPYVADDVYFIDGTYDGDFLIVTATDKHLCIYAFNPDSIGDLLCDREFDNELWVMSYYEEYFYALEYYVSDDGYTNQRLIRFNATETECVCALPHSYGFMQPWDDRLYVSPKNSFARFGNSGVDEKTFQTGIYLLESVNTDCIQRFIPLFDMKYPYHEYSEGRYHTPAPVMIWLNDENILCFLVRQEIRDKFPGISCNDAVVVNTRTGAVEPYLKKDNAQLIIKDRILSGYPSQLGENEYIALNISKEYSLYPVEWWNSSLPADVGCLSLSDGSIAPIACYEDTRSIGESPVTKSIIIHF